MFFKCELRFKQEWQNDKMTKLCKWVSKIDEEK